MIETKYICIELPISVGDIMSDAIDTAIDNMIKEAEIKIWPPHVTSSHCTEIIFEINDCELTKNISLRDLIRASIDRHGYGSIDEKEGLIKMANELRELASEIESGT